jgi:hypothetical protein
MSDLSETMREIAVTEAAFALANTSSQSLTDQARQAIHAFEATMARFALSGTSDHRSEADRDNAAVDLFAQAMRDKLAQARLKGRAGWQQCEILELWRMLRAHVEKDDPRDIANFAMMIWHNIGQQAGGQARI